MAFGFNAFAGPTSSDASTMVFSVTNSLPGQPNIEIRIFSTLGNLSYTAGPPPQIGGTMDHIEIWDTTNNLIVGDVGANLNIGPNPWGDLGALLNAFLVDSFNVVNDTFTAWSADLTTLGYSSIGAAAFAPDGTSATFELLDMSSAVVGYYKVTGTGIFSDKPETSGTISSIQLLDASQVPVGSDSVSYPTPISLSALSYGLLSLGVPGLGNDELIWNYLLAGNDNITTSGATDIRLDGGPGVDNLVGSSSGAILDYSYATSAVVVHLLDGSGITENTASGGAGNDTLVNQGGGNFNFNTNSYPSDGTQNITQVVGSQFDDSITGNNVANGFDALFGMGGDDTLSGADGTDYLDGGAGNDTLSGGLGDDLFFGESGNDTISGDGQSGQYAKDVLLYSRIVIPQFIGGGADRGIGAELYADGITVTYDDVTAGKGTVASSNPLDTDNIGTDTFDGIEAVWGTKNVDTFNGGAQNDYFVGMRGNDIFNGGGGSDTVDYLNEFLDPTVFTSFLAGTFKTGVIVNLSSTDRLGVTAGTGKDIFGDTDHFTNVENITGTINNDVLIGNASANTFIGQDGSDWFIGGGGIDTFWGNSSPSGGGKFYDFDTVDYSIDGGTAGIVATFAANGTATVKDTFGNTDTLHNIFAVRGTDFNDTFVGSTNVESFFGGKGNDTYTSGGSQPGLGGQDEISYLTDVFDTVPTGGDIAGIDYDATRVSGQIKTNSLTSTFWGTDTLIGFNRIWLEATVYDDILKGGAGDDIFFGSYGTDIIDGRGGVNAISYIDFRSNDNTDPLFVGGITVNAGAGASTSGTVTDTGGSTDTYANISTFAGSNFADTFNGNDANETFIGHGGADTIHGGGGTDTIDYTFDIFFGSPEKGVIVNLGPIDFDFQPQFPLVLAGTALDGSGSVDTIDGVERYRPEFFALSILAERVPARASGVLRR